MPARTLAAFATAATARGLDAATPAIAVANATRADETVVAAPIAELPARLTAADLGRPVIVMIGRVFAERAAAGEASAQAASPRGDGGGVADRANRSS
jgi:uroporphyrin-III C-methyltransferase / precorrin-2 dehydrogenase / sirohydrochlorin ferrochelatase